MTSQPNRPDHHPWVKPFILLLALESALTAIYIFIQPFLFVKSQPRELTVTSAVLIGGFLLLSLVLFWLYAKRSTRVDSFVSKSHTSGFRMGLLGLYFLAVISSTATVLPTSSVSEFLQPYFIRFNYLIIFLAVVSIEIFIFGFLSTNTIHFEFLFHNQKKRWITVGGIFGFLLLLWLFVAVTHFGNSPDELGWRQLGSPLLMWQTWLALGTGLGVMVFQALFPSLITEKNRIRTLWVIALIIYVLTVLIWNSQPVQTAYTAPRMRLPNMERYPYSDSMYYNASAESVLIGDGLLNWSVVPRPYFITILSYLIQISGGSFDLIVKLQTFLLAFIPVLLLLIGARLGGTSLGVAAAVAAILRELTAIQATAYIPVSHSRLILSDMPTLLVFLLFCLVLIQWIQDKANKPRSALLCGGVLGLLMLFRTQMLVLLPFVIIILLIKIWRQWKVFFKQSVIFILGLILVILPWIIRNAAITGGFAFDDQNTQTSVLLARYQLDSAEDDPAQQNNPSITSTILRNPGFVAGFTVNHFLRNQIAVLFVTPPQSANANLPTLFAMTNYWKRTPLQIPPGWIWQIPTLLLLITVGLVYTTKRVGLVAWIPMVLQVAYSISNGLARNSGGRYNLIIDWVGYLYLAAGLVGIISWMLRSESQVPQIGITETKVNLKQDLILSGILLLLVGCFISFTEIIHRPRFTSMDLGTAVNTAAAAKVDLKSIIQNLNGPDLKIINGRMLYPRFYPSDDGEGGSSWAAFAPQPYRRMGFLVIGPDGLSQVIARMKTPPKTFPNRSDIIVLGKDAVTQVRGKDVHYLKAEWILLESDPLIVCRLADDQLLTCQ